MYRPCMDMEKTGTIPTYPVAPDSTERPPRAPAAQSLAHTDPRPLVAVPMPENDRSGQRGVNFL